MPVWEALERFVAQIGWDLRWRWQGPMKGQLTLFEPPRQGERESVLTLDDQDYFELSSFNRSLESVRNTVYVTFGPPEDRQTVLVTHTPSQTAWRFPRVMWIEEASNSGLQTQAEALRMASAAVKDLAHPKLAMTLTMPFFPWLELHDQITVRGGGKHFDRDMAFVVVGISHELSGGRGVTTLSLQDGAPTSGEGRWLRREFREGVKYL